MSATATAPVTPVRLSDVLARLLHPTDRMLAACRHVIVENIPPRRVISPSPGSSAIVCVGGAAREVLFEAAHELAREYDMEIAP